MIENRHVVVATSSTLRNHTADLPSRQRARRTNDPFSGIDTKTARGRRIADLVRAYLSALGDPVDVEQQASVIAAAELQVLAEAARTAALKETGHANLDQVVRVQGAADRALRRLHIGPRTQRDPEQTLDQYLRDRYGGDEEPAQEIEREIAATQIAPTTRDFVGRGHEPALTSPPPESEIAAGEGPLETAAPLTDQTRHT
jgi:hypothetical protein